MASRRRVIAALLTLTVAVAACSGDDDANEADSSTSVAAEPTTAEAASTTAPPPPTSAGSATSPSPQTTTATTATTGPTTTTAEPDEPSDSPDAGETRVVTFDGVDTAAPDRFDRVRVIQHGPAAAANVLVLVPGTSAGAAYFSPVALDIVAAAPGWQVWSIDRRENLLEDHSMHARFVAGDATAQESFDYYLGWLGDDTITDHFQPRGGVAGDGDGVDFTRDWGMSVAVGDLGVVIDEATAMGGDVVLGGHSLGGSITIAYATWDFDGRAGADDLAGLALIDGGSGAGMAPTPAEARAELADLETSSPFNDIVGLGLPWAAGVFNMLGSTAAVLTPEEASVGWVSPLIPANLKPPVQPNNEAQYGYALDEETSPPGLELVELHLGRLASRGSPRGWVDDGPVPVERAGRMFSGVLVGDAPGPTASIVGDSDDFDGIDGTAWYHPRRLSIDSGAVNGGIRNPAQRVLDVRAIHGDDLSLPIYALETRLGAGRVLAGAQLLAQQSDIPADDVTLVDRSDSLTHTDPLAIQTGENPVLATLVPFLQDLP